MITWSRLHGIVSLEVQGLFNGMGHEAGTLLTVEVESIADSTGSAGREKNSGAGEPRSCEDPQPWRSTTS
ncbi:WHG domain-containing protein [Streptomyces lunaelactis]|uniref:TetR-like C-terminal domain-containing protein n=1 Tax=Streptomyces lunaelactis TaxID=1535768 RepID=UPI0015850C83|nr:TetR-like C-terminal domain-containing protein [Streptomyces lunaelactis]NUK54626.1 WHG domain-containing protein [Streptomyces lunaelactis]